MNDSSDFRKSRFSPGYSGSSSVVLKTSIFLIGPTSYKVDLRESNTGSRFIKISVKLPPGPSRPEGEMKYSYVPENAVEQLITALQRVYYRSKSTKKKSSPQ